jgi:hypothetical protein
MIHRIKKYPAKILCGEQYQISPMAKLCLLAMRGVSDETALSLADGELQFVFDIAPKPKTKRELRFWVREVENPKAVAALTINAVIAQIVPRRDAIPGQFCGLRNWEVGNLLRASRATLISLRDELAARPRSVGGIWIPRSALENFLRSRWLGNFRSSRFHP